LLALVMVLSSGRSWGLGQLRNVVRVDSPYRYADSTTFSGWRTWVADRELYGIGGLRVTGLGASYGWGRYRSGVRLWKLATPVGTETSGSCGGAVQLHRCAVEVRFEGEQLSLEGSRPLSLVSATIAGICNLSDRWFLVSTCSGVRLAGVESAGADLEVALGNVSSAGVTLMASLTADRLRGSGWGVVGEYKPVSLFSFGMSYEGLSGELGARVTVIAGRVDLIALAHVHHVMGGSKGVVLVWHG